MDGSRMAAQRSESAAFVTPDAYFFSGHRFEPSNGLLTRGGVEIRLRPKTAAVLAVLVSRAGEVVTKAELVDEVWDGTTGDESLAVCVAELRRALGEHPQDAGCIATAHRRGYRFVVAVTTTPEQAAADAEPPTGRERELAELSSWWSSAASGARTVGFVAGEAGAGKSALVEAFVAGLRGPVRIALGMGRCVDERGREPYLPFLDAFAAICRGASGARFREILWDIAPTWLLMLPGLVEPSAAQDLRRRAADRSVGRLLREAADALDAMAAIAPVVIVIEDLHVGDSSTIELLGHLAQRPTRARLLVLATYRPDPAPGRRLPLGDAVGSLRALRRCEHLDLGPLDVRAVTMVLTSRLAPGVPSAELAGEVLARTEGNALFVSTLVDRLIGDGMLREDGGVLHTTEPIARLGIPDGVRRLTADRIARLDPSDRDLLMAAAASGIEFTVVEAAAGLAAFSGNLDSDLEPDRVAVELTRLAELTGLIVEVEPATWPDGSISGCFRFAHALVRDVAHEQLAGARRVAVHRAIGARLATGAGARAAAAAEHFELGRDPASAVEQYGRAAEAARRRLAPRTARDLARHAIDLADSAGGVVSPAARLGLQLSLLAALLAEHGPTSPEVAEAVDTAEALADGVDDGLLVARARHVAWSIAFMTGDIITATIRIAALEAAAGGLDDAALALQLADARALTLLAAGSPALALEAAQRHRPVPIAANSPARSHALSEAAVLGRSSAALASWLVGRADDARFAAHDGLRLAREAGTPGALCRSLWPVVAVHQLRGERARVRQHAAELARVAEVEENSRWAAIAGTFDAWARLDGADPATAAFEVLHLVDRLVDDGMGFGRPYHLGLAAEAAAACGDAERALVTIESALAAVAATGDRWYLAELLRNRAEALLDLADEHPTGRTGFAREADALLDESVAVARSQGARAIELRALTTVVRRGRPAVDGPAVAAAMLRRLLNVLAEGVGPADRLAAESALRGTRAVRSARPVVATGSVLN